jgi:hypothetical protein
MQMHLKRTRPTTGVLPHHGELEIAGRNGCANTILATTMDPRRPKEV